jgi:glycosyltransferase involved in cell wall biosynthesis
LREARVLSSTPTCKITVIVPTKNEAPNVEPLASKLAGVLGTLHSGRWELLFVDDSDDSTPEAIAHLGAPVRMLHREAGDRRGGLGGAVKEGFVAAGGDVLAVMDGDLQHPPETLPVLVAPVIAGEADLAVGSRYGPSAGHVTGLAGPWRRAVSIACRWLVHMAVPRSRPVEDPLSGLFALDRRVVEGVALSPDGFKILLEVLARGRWQSVRNVHYAFGRRHAGSSKANVRVGLSFVRHLLKLAIAGWAGHGRT